ncbi:uncharacterized protein LOC123693320 [Colias croceus]|uniref:uncharacterized protein LOC123693320 n=1 Tax=Colias crocea TaxID=72248 RepID=UPI001E27D43C|nr:uncharacterized protein LOC123693320 [Colias croceus]
MLTLMTSEYIAFFTQKNLSDKQASDQIMFAISHPILMSYSFSILYYRKDIRKLLFKLSVVLKEGYNDLEIETQMIRKAKLYSTFYVMSFSAALFFYAFDGIMQVVKKGDTFTTVILAWPDVQQRGILPDFIRIAVYFLWWLFMFRVSAVYVLVISLTITLSYQYKNLQSYFYKLEDIFKDVNVENFEQKEKEYERALKVGISLHSDTIWCVRECQRICSWVFSGQITFNFTVFCMLMLQMVNSERTLMGVLATLSTSASLLMATGFFMCNAGDITVEAAALPTAIFFSGWQHCRGATSVRIRNLLVVAICQSQKPVEIQCFNVIKMSYQSFVSIVKASYSVFSILY